MEQLVKTTTCILKTNGANRKRKNGISKVKKNVQKMFSNRNMQHFKSPPFHHLIDGFLSNGSKERSCGVYYIWLIR